MLRPPLLLGCLALAACSGSGSGDLAADAAIDGSAYVALDLASRRVVPVATPIDAGDPAWRDGRILFRLLPAAPASLGRPVGDDLTEEDERPLRPMTTSRYWIGVFELTQAQWERLAGTTPWYEAVPFGVQDAFISPARPAIALTPEAVVEAVAGWAPDGWTLDAPSEVEWERACLGGTADRYAWGNVETALAVAADATPYAIWDADGSGGSRPRPVGSSRANAAGIFDMHGNAAEIVHARAGGWEARGGAWDMPPLACRASNHLPLAATTAGWNLGVRLVLRR